MKRAFVLKCFAGVALLCAGDMRGAPPASPYYPFAPTELSDLRMISKAESIPNSPELSRAWELYRQVQGSWQPGAQKPGKQIIAQIDDLKRKLEAARKPKWFKEALASNRPPSERIMLPAKVGDAAFVDQADSAEYQSQKALGIVYLAEHEIDRPNAADRAGRYLALLSIKHPWDWQVHALYARLLIDAGAAGPGFRAAAMSIYLNPGPSVADLQFFAFVGAACKQEREAIVQTIKEAAADETTARETIEQTAQMFDAATKVQVVPPAASK